MPLLVNGESVDDALIRDELRAIRPRLFEAMQGEDPASIETRARQWARENVIERVLLRQAALADPEPLPAQAVDGPEAELRLRIARLYDRATAHLAPPRHKDLVEHYRKHRDTFGAPERVRVAHIVKNVEPDNDGAQALELMQRLHGELLAGASFQELADQHSDCPGKGGDLGVFPRGEMVEEFDAVVFALEPGQISAVFRTQFGFHIAKVSEKHPPGIRPLEEVSPELLEFLFEQKRQRAMEQFLDRLWAKAVIRDGQPA